MTKDIFAPMRSAVLRGPPRTSLQWFIDIAVVINYNAKYIHSPCMNAITPDANKKQDEMTRRMYGLGLCNNASSSIHLRIESQTLLLSSCMNPFVKSDIITFRG